MKPKPSAKNVTGDFDKFTNFARQILSVPHSEIKATTGRRESGEANG